jgi:hypothetical protein
LRQAYDYWQDQPGNYFPKPERGGLNTKVIASSRELSLGWEFIVQGPITVSVRPQTRVCVPPRGGVHTSRAPDDLTTLFPRSHKSQTHFSASSGGRGSWPSMRTTSEWHHLKDAHGHGGSPSGYLTDRFSHRQAIHNPLSSHALITNVWSLTEKTLSTSKEALHQSGPHLSRSAYPDAQARL